MVDNEHRHRSCLGTRNPFDTIPGVVDVARPGATIWVCPGLYEETVKVETPHLTLKGPTPAATPPAPAATASRS